MLFSACQDLVFDGGVDDVSKTMAETADVFCFTQCQSSQKFPLNLNKSDIPLALYSLANGRILVEPQKEFILRVVRVVGIVVFAA